MANPKREQPDAAAPIGVQPADDADEWDTIPTGGLGDEWDFDHDGILIGNYLGSREVETPKLESGVATAHLFAPVVDPDRIVFLWESSELATAFGSAADGTSLIRVGDKVRVTFLGIRQFTGKKGPQQIKQYKVEAAKRATTG